MIKEKFPDPKSWLNIQVCESIYKAFKDHAAVFGLTPPASDFASRHDDILEAICGSVQLRASLTNQDVIEVAVSYFVKLARSQAFFDGNKRMSVVLTNMFLLVNGYILNISPEKLKDVAVLIVEDKHSSNEEVINILLPKFRQLLKRT